MEQREVLELAQVTGAEQAGVDWLTCLFPGRAEHRNIVEFSFAAVRLSVSDSILALIWLL